MSVENDDFDAKESAHKVYTKSLIQPIKRPSHRMLKLQSESFDFDIKTASGTTVVLARPESLPKIARKRRFDVG